MNFLLYFIACFFCLCSEKITFHTTETFQRVLKNIWSKFWPFEDADSKWEWKKEDGRLKGNSFLKEMKNLLGQVNLRTGKKTDSSSIFLNSRWILLDERIWCIQLNDKLSSVIQIVAKYFNDRDYV